MFVENESTKKLKQFCVKILIWTRRSICIVYKNTKFIVTECIDTRVKKKTTEKNVDIKANKISTFLHFSIRKLLRAKKLNYLLVFRLYDGLDI